MKKFDYSYYNVTVTPLTPLHIGSGANLLKDYDYAVKKNRTWRLNEDALLAEQTVDDPAMADTLAQTPPAQLLDLADFRQDSPYFRYSLPGTPRAKGAGAQLVEQLKTVDDQVYLPGSSLKGAIRTALAWHGWAEKKIKGDKQQLGRRKQWAGQRFEQKIMGNDPNHDLLRALQISDSLPAGKEQLVLLNVQVVTRRELGSPIELEAIKPDTPLQLSIKVDNRLLSPWAKQNGLKLGGNDTWLNRLVPLIKAYSQQRINDELMWYKNRQGAEATAGFYQQLKNAQLPSGSCLLQLGWGTGWGGKTYGNHLKADKDFMEHLISNYRLAKGKRRRGDDFPKSRRTIVRVVKNKQGTLQPRPSIPLGWVLMEMEERKEASQ